MTNWEKHIIRQNTTIREALALMDQLGIVNNDLFVVDENKKLLGSMSDGDIRRAMIKGAGVDDNVEKAMYPDPTTAAENSITGELIRKCKQKNIRFIPVINENKQVINIIDIDTIRGQLPVDAVLMAGGKGSRLLPLTENTPKPLLKVGDKAIIEHNIDRLIRHGVSNFYISINYLGHMIQDHFGNGAGKGVNIKYIEENEPMGTIGSVKLEKSYASDSLLVMNSDLLTNINFSDFYNAFIESGADMCVAVTTYTIDVPYAVLDLSDANLVLALKEKPTYTYHSNGGIYLIKKDLLELIPDNTFFDITDLMEKMIKFNKTVYAFPIMGYWLDIGKMDDYRRAQEDIRYLKF